MSDDEGGLSRQQKRVVVQVAQACGSLSFLGSAVIVVANFRFKQLRTYSFQLIVWLAVCDIAVNLSFFVGSPSDGSGLCFAQAVVQQFFQVALIQWTLLISQSLLVVASNTRVFDGKKRMPWNHLWAWGTSAALTIGPFWTNSFGETDCSFCWIKDNGSRNADSAWRGLFLLVVFLSMVAIVWTYVSVIERLGRAQRGISLLSSRTADRSTYSVQQHGIVKKRKIFSTAAVSSQSVRTVSNPTSANPGAPMRLSFGPTVKTGQASNHLGQGLSSEAKSVEGSNELQLRRSILERVIPRAQNGERDGSESRRLAHSPSSLLSITRSNSQVSSKNWLWSASRELGFSEDKNEFGDDGDDDMGVLWLNVATVPRSSPSIVERSPPLPTLLEAESAVTTVWKPGGHTGGSSASSPSITWERKVHTTRLAIARSSSGPSFFGGAAATRARERELTIADNLSRSKGCTIGQSASFGGQSTDLSAATPGSAVAAPKRPVKSRIVDGAGRARSFVHRMSSLDVDQHSRSVVRSSNNVSTKDNGVGDNVSSLEMALRSSSLRRAHGGAKERNAQTTRLSGGRKRSGDMEKFISRVKWYPVIYAMCWIFTLINGIYTLVAGAQHANLTLVVLAVATSRLQGLFNFVWYGLNDRLKQAWLQDSVYRRAVASCCRAVLCCCSGPCFPTTDDEEDGSRAGEEDADGSIAEKFDQAESEASPFANEGAGLAASVEAGGKLTTLVTIQRTPSRGSARGNATSVAPLRTPRGIHLKRIPPARPTRPNRKTSTQNSRRKKKSRTRLSRAVISEHLGLREEEDTQVRETVASTQPGISPFIFAALRRSTPARPRLATARSVTAPSSQVGGDKNRGGQASSMGEWNGGKRKSPALCPALPITISMPIVDRPAGSISGDSSRESSSDSAFFVSDSSSPARSGGSSGLNRERYWNFDFDENSHDSSNSAASMSSAGYEATQGEGGGGADGDGGRFTEEQKPTVARGDRDDRGKKFVSFCNSTRGGGGGLAGEHIAVAGNEVGPGVTSRRRSNKRCRSSG